MGWQHLQALRQCSAPLFVSVAHEHVFVVDPITLFPRELNTHDAVAVESIQGSPWCTIDQDPCQRFVISANSVYSWSAFAGHILEKTWRSDHKIVAIQARERECHTRVVCLQTDPLRNVIEQSALLNYHAQEFSISNANGSVQDRSANALELLRALEAMLPSQNNQSATPRPAQVMQIHT